jgi:hypothetical protein
VKQRFRRLDNDKTLIISGPSNWGMCVLVDYDDVDHREVDANVRKLIKLLNTHWPEEAK